MLVEFGSESNVGRVREHNEDAYEYIHYSGGDVLMVCDGMGGHAAGDVASGLARASIAAALLKDQYQDPRELLYRALEAAHEKVLSVASASDARAGMGTTAVVALVRDGGLYLGHVGDSRAYLVRDGVTNQLTRDQTRVQEMVDHGVLSEEAAKSHPDAGVLAQAIGQPRGLMPFVTPEREGIPLRHDDILILCTDGVYDAFGSQEFASMVQHRTAEEAAQILVQTAVERDGQDNATAVVGILRDRGRSGAPASTGSAPPARGMASDAVLPRPSRRRSQAWVVGAALLGVALLAFLVGRFSRGSAGAANEQPGPRPEEPLDRATLGSSGAVLDRLAPPAAAPLRSATGRAASTAECPSPEGPAPR